MRQDNTQVARKGITILLVVMVTFSLAVAFAGTAVAADDAQNDTNGNETANADDEIPDDQDDETPSDAEEERCEADIDQFDLHTADSVIDGADDPGRIGVTAVTSITNECPVTVQVTFDIPNNMYYQGTSAGSSGQGLQTEVFEVQPGDTASFTTELYANQPGEHTVTASIEYFPEDQPEVARTLDNLMLSFDVQDPIPEEEWPNGGVDDGGVDDGGVDDGGVDDGGVDDGGVDDGGVDDGGVDDGGADDEPGPGILGEIAENLVTVMAVFFIGTIGLVAVWKGAPIIITGLRN